MMNFCNINVAKLPWTSITTIMDKIKNIEQRNWYIMETVRNGWSRPIILNQIELNLYERILCLKKC